MKEREGESVKNLVTKDDLTLLRQEFRSEIKDVRSEIKEFRSELNALFYKLLASIGGIMVVSIGIVTWLSKVIN